MRYIIFLILNCFLYGNNLWDIGKKVIFAKKEIKGISLIDDKFIVATSTRIGKNKNIVLNVFENNGTFISKLLIDSNSSQTLKAINSLTLFGIDKSPKKNKTIFVTHIDIEKNSSQIERFNIDNFSGNFYISNNSYFIERKNKNCNFELLKLGKKGIQWETEGEKFSKNKALIISNQRFSIVAKERKCQKGKVKRWRKRVKTKESILLYRVNNNNQIAWQINFQSKLYSIELKSLDYYNQNIFLLTQKKKRKKRKITELIKIKRDGTIVLEKELNYDIDRLIVLKGGEYLIYGKTFKNFRGLGNDNIIAKLDKNFKLVWLQKIEDKLGKITSIKITDNNYVLLMKKNERKDKISYRTIKSTLQKVDKLKVINILTQNEDELENYLTKQNIDLNSTLMYKNKPLVTTIIESNNLEKLKILRKFGLKLNTSKPINSFSNWFLFNMRLIEYLFNNGYKFRKTDNKGYTPLASAILHQNISLVQLLLAYNMVDIDSGFGRKNPLILSIITKNRDILNLLIQSGAKIDMKIKASYLFKNIKRNNQEIITMQSQNENLPNIPIVGSYIEIVSETYENKVFIKNDDLNVSYLYDF